MKFGKRLSAEAERQWQDSYIDYKALKRAIQADVDARDPAGPAFERAIRHELQKVSAFYVEKEEELGGVLARLCRSSPEAIAAFRSEVTHLRKYQVLNYVGVVKAAKKRNRHLKAACGAEVRAVWAVEILSQQYFFTSPKLASLATQAELLTQALQPVTDTLLQEFQCPICLDLLRSPVLLTCAHRFCWGCLVAHCTTALGRLSEAAPGPSSAAAKEGGKSADAAGPAAAAALVRWEGESSDDEQTLATFDCPVCRKAQLLDLDRLQVDPPLDAFVRKLQCEGRLAAAAQQPPQQQAALAAVRQSLDDSEDELAVQPMAVDEESSPSSNGQAEPGPGGAASAEVLSVEAMDAVLRYLHFEHAQQEAQRAQQGQEGSAEPGLARPAAAAAAQRVASQPLAIGTRSAQQQDEMEVEAKPSAHSSLLAASEAQQEQQQPAKAAAAVPAPARARPPAVPQPRPSAARPPAAPAPKQAAAAGAAAAVVAQAPAPQVVLVEQQQPSMPASGEPPLLPPQRPEDQGKLTVCLDLDGTLVSTFTPKRAPVLPAAAVSYVVGRGGKLNPGGVFVVERPGLAEFFQRMAPVAEVVLFTAGLEDYAKPICDALQAKYGCFLHRLYRPACVPDEVYPCVKDMSRLGRDLRRTLLVDDTPLAFFYQPDNGIPVLQFRGDVDDQLLSEAVAPLIESLADVHDVRSVLSRRFNMERWFQAQGLVAAPRAALTMHRAPSMPTLGPRPASAPPAAGPAPAPRVLPSPGQYAPSGLEVLNDQRQRGLLLVCDFDKTLIHYDAGERLCDELAPELTSLLSHLEMPANFVPVTNTVLAEMQRRGVSRDRILATLRTMGQEMPLASVRMLQWASRAGIDVRVLSDCNCVFINHVLTGAKVNSCVREVITNLSAFQRVEEPAAAAARPHASWLHRAFGGGGGGAADAAKPASQRLVVTPRHPYHECCHGCPLCPENLCKGQELEQVWQGSRPKRTIYCGDGANDLCPALRLGPNDVVLARKGHILERLIAKRAAAPEGVRRVRAQVHTWSSHEELWQLVQDAACGC